MKQIRKMLAVTLAMIATLSMLLMSGCSTPDVAMTVDGKEYATGEYLANLYINYYQGYYESGLYQYASYGMDPWEQKFPYGEEDEQVDMVFADYLVQTTKDNLVRQKAVKNLLEKYGLSVPEEEMKTFEEEMKTYQESEMLAFGFNKEHYMNAYVAMNMEEQALFYGLYDEGGERAVSETDIRAFFDKSYAAYKGISISQMGSDGAALSDADKEANRTTLQKYLDLFNQNNDMDAVIKQYNEDTAEESEEETTTTEETEEVDNTQLVNSVTGDEKIVEVVMSVAEKTAQIVEYTDSNDQTYIALIYRLNVEEAGGENYYEDQHDTLLYGLKFDEFDTEVKGVVDTLEVDYNDRAIKMCDPKNFEKVAAANS